MAGSFNKSRKKRAKNRTSSKQLVVVEPEDRLSLLPQELRSLVLSFLPLQEAVKASILSKMWRKMWHSLPHMIFYYNQFPDMERKLDHFLEFIRQTLIHHDESNIETFELQVWPLNQCHADIINEWVLFSEQHNVQKFILCGVVEDLQKLPDRLFTCSSLITLELAVGKLFFKWPMAVALPNLKKLTLRALTLSEENFMLDLSSSCPVLESLSIIICNLMIVKVLAISASRIKDLTIYYCQGIENCEIKLQTPSLESFYYVDNVARDYNFSNLSSLSLAYISLSEAYPTEKRDGYNQCAIKVSAGLCSAKCLRFNQFFIQLLCKAHYVSQQLSAISFDKLETMTLCLWPIKEQVQVAFLLLSRCPKLRGISIIVTRSEGWSPNMPNQDLESANMAFPLILNALVYVKIENFEGNESEMELVRLFLENAHKLVQMEIVIACESDETGLEKLLGNEKILKIIGFNRASAALLSF